MARTDTEKRVRLLQKKLHTTHLEIEQLQAECQHPSDRVTKECGANQGNLLDKDIFWRSYHCEICDKRWTEYYE